MKRVVGLFSLLCILTACQGVRSVETVSRTLESVYDDYCVARMAQAMGKREDQALFQKRAGYYKNLFDDTTGLMRGRDSQGN